MARIIQLHRVGNWENATKSAAHKTDKVSPKMDGKSSLATKPKPKRRCACCGEHGHTRKDCPEPHYKQSTPSPDKRKRNNDEITEDDSMKCLHNTYGNCTVRHLFISGCNSRVLSTMTNILCREHRDDWARVHGLFEPST
jgi:hypothetical protein